MAPRPIIRPRAPVARQHLLRLRRGVHVAVGDDRARHRLDGLADEIVVHRQPVHLRDGAPVHRQQVERVPREDRQQLVELLRRVEAEPRLDGELDLHRVAQRAEDRVDALRLAQQPAAGALAVDDRRRAAEVQVDRGDRVLLQLPRGAHERRNVVADHLRDDRPAGGVAGDGVENPLLRRRRGVDAEVLGPVNVRAAVAVHELPERAVGHVLHRRQRQDRRRAGQQGGEWRHAASIHSGGGVIEG